MPVLTFKRHPGKDGSEKGATIAARRYPRAASTSAAIARNGWMKSRALVISRSGEPQSIKPPTKASNAATINNTRRNQTPDAAETAVLAAVGVKPEEFSDTLASCDSSTGHHCNRSNR